MLCDRHALPPARPAGRASRALQRFLDHVAAARPRLGLPPHRHRAALDSDASLHRRRTHEGHAACLTLDQLNAAGASEFVALLDGIYEHSPWIAERAAAAAAVREPRRS